MSEDKKPGFWGKLFGRDANKHDVEKLNPAENLETAVDVAHEDVAHDVAPPEMQAEWVDAGGVNPPVETKTVPEEIHNPLDKPAGLKLSTEDDAVDAELVAEAQIETRAQVSADAETALIIDVGEADDVSDARAVENAEPVITKIVQQAETSVVHAAEAVVDAIEEAVTEVGDTVVEIVEAFDGEQDIPAAVTPAVETPVTEKPKSWFERLSSGLKRSSDNLTTSISSIFTKKKLDEATLQDLEDTLIGADLGIDTALAITEKLRVEKFDKDVSGHEVRLALAEEITRVLEPVAQPLVIDASKKPYVILMIGVNGSGKTTSIGKLTAKLKAEGKTVLLAAGDTFRAAAVEQLQVWGQRNNVDVVTRPTGADASGLAFDALQRARAENTDVLIIDTAGRLQNRSELMDELEKIIRVIKKIDAEAPHATILTLDATTGQNALNQAEIFGKKAGVTGLIMTKLDGTARGGILVAIARKFNLPVHFIGVGESIGDLEPFRADDFAKVISGLDGDK